MTGFDGCHGRGERHAIENLALLVEGGIVQQHLEHEAVHLGFGQRVGAFLVNRVLGREHEEGRRQGHGLAAEGDLPFLHGFEQGGLHLGRRAVDFIGQDEVGEDGAFGGTVFPILRIIDERADDIGGEQVRA